MNQLVTLISQIYFGMKFYMFPTVPLSFIRSLLTVNSAMVYVLQFCRKLSSRTRMELILVLLESYLKTCRLSCQNKCVKLVFLVGFIIKKFVTMAGHMNVKF